jgi:hypothetical protein
MEKEHIRVIDVPLLQELMDADGWTLNAQMYVEEALRHYEHCTHKYSGCD